MEEKFKFLKTTSGILKILSWIPLLVAIIQIIAGIFRAFEGYVPEGGIYLLISFFTLQAIARIADVVLEIEKNTRK